MNLLIGMIKRLLLRKKFVDEMERAVLSRLFDAFRTIVQVVFVEEM
jgi:hypothetical protein